MGTGRPYASYGRHARAWVCALCLLCWLSITVVPAGHVGVRDLLGNVHSRALPPGLHLVLPFTKVVRMTVRTQLIETTEDVPTQEGLDVHLEAAALFHLDAERAVEIYKTVGPDYSATVVLPLFRSATRDVTSAHQAKDLYTSEARLGMMTHLRNGFETAVAPRGIVVEATPLKTLQLPRSLQTAIEGKLQAEQAAEKMRFILDWERQEVRRKTIEAEGIARFQRLVSGNISRSLLRWKGMELTEALARSPNPKLIIIGVPGRSPQARRALTHGNSTLWHRSPPHPASTGGQVASMEP
eukprot:GGOE01049439.1.p2 GENE.GGOE01049439.1~~GGOE01049439.1.p2  ORF type:complete len:298 (-),score=83.64 GGOE01049439.1:149-1042(-)